MLQRAQPGSDVRRQRRQLHLEPAYDFHAHDVNGRRRQAHRADAKEAQGFQTPHPTRQTPQQATTRRMIISTLFFNYTFCFIVLFNPSVFFDIGI